MEAFIENDQVYDKGTLIIHDKKSAKFIFAEDFKIKIQFSGEDEANPNIKGALVNNELVLTFENFNNVFGISSIEPLIVGEYNNNKIGLLYAVNTIKGNQGKTRVFNYTWIQRKVEVQNG